MGWGYHDPDLAKSLRQDVTELYTISHSLASGKTMGCRCDLLSCSLHSAELCR